MNTASSFLISRSRSSKAGARTRVLQTDTCWSSDGLGSAEPAQAENEGTGIAFYGATSIWLYAAWQTLGVWTAPFAQATAIA